MSERSYTTVDKSEWPRGEWHDEPDKIQWVDEATGLDCLIVRNAGGALCGYVGVPPEHPWHGVDYWGCPKGEEREPLGCEHCPDAHVEVHGGLTYADACQESDDPSRGICHVPEPGRPDDVWWFGFDCAHAGDVSPKWDAAERFDEFLGYSSYKWVGYVKQEVRNLARQIAEVTA